MKDIQKVIKGIDKLPTLPLVVTKLTDLVTNPHTSASDIQNVITKDQALSARVLKLVNSAFYGFSERISSISHAIVILGFNTIKNIALSASVFEMFDKEHGESQLDKEGFWMHSIAVAGASKLIARHLRLTTLEDIFVAGLLHDVGKIILDQFMHEEYRKVIDIVGERNILIAEAEYEVLELSHSQVGAYLATNWKLPAALVQMIGLHHKPELAGDFAKHTFCVHLADILVRALEIGSGGDNRMPMISKSLWEEYGFDSDKIRMILDVLEEELQDVENFVKGI
ncbi:HDOD domain-containing protein [Candidatus Omnitrophota bacterium]